MITYPYDLRASVMRRSKKQVGGKKKNKTQQKHTWKLWTFDMNVWYYFLKKGWWWLQKNRLHWASVEPFCYCKEFLHYLAHTDLCCQFPEMQGQNLCFYKLFKTALSAQVLTHSWSPTGCLPPVGRPCQSQRCGCCSSHQGAGFRASGLCDCTNTTGHF